MKARQAMLGKWLFFAVKRLSLRRKDFGSRPERFFHNRFLSFYKKRNPDYAPTVKTISNDVAALCRDPDFRACWEALVSGRVDAALKAVASLGRDATKGADVDSLMRWYAKERADGGYADIEVDPNSVLPDEDEDSFLAGVERLVDGAS